MLKLKNPSIKDSYIFHTTQTISYSHHNQSIKSRGHFEVQNLHHNFTQTYTQNTVTDIIYHNLFLSQPYQYQLVILSIRKLDQFAVKYQYAEE